MKGFRYIFVFCAGFLACAGVCAQVVVDTTKVTEIDPLVIRSRQNVEIVPAQVLSGAELERLGGNSISDALRYFAGAQIKDYGGVGGLKTVNIRSMGSQHVGVFYDGVQIGNAQNGVVDLGRFSLDNMEAVSLYNGQKSDIFQSAKDFASASAIYMVTRKPVFSDGRRDNLTLKLKGGSFDYADGSVLWERSINPTLSSSVNAEFMNTSGKYKFRYGKTDGYDTTEVRRNSDVMFLRAEAALFGKMDRGEWQAKVYFYGSERGVPGAVVKDDYAISLLNESRQKDVNAFAQVSVRRNPAPFYSYKLQAKYAYDYANYAVSEETTVQPYDTMFWQEEAYFTFANLFGITKWWSANLSVDAQWNKLDARDDVNAIFGNNFPQPRRYAILGAAATSVRLGRVSMQGSVLYTYVGDVSARGMEMAADKSVWTPAFIISYKPWNAKEFRLRAFYKDIFRMPTFNDLYYVQVGNRLLKPEYTKQYDVGFTYDKSFSGRFFEGLSVQADAYYNEVKDKIIATPATNQSVWTMVNLGYVEIRGVDVAVNPRFRIGNVSLCARLAYTYQKAQDFTEGKDTGIPGVDEVYGHQIAYIPRHSGTVVLSAAFGGWDFNYSFIYTGERYMLGGNIPVNYIQPWYTHDLSASKVIKSGRRILKVTAEVNNIFNQQYEVVKWYPMPGTNLKITLSLSL